MEGKDVCWHVLLGAMLASPTVRKQALAVIQRQDAPKALQPLWDALASADPARIWGCVDAIGMNPRGSGKIIDQLLLQLQQDALGRFIKKTMQDCEFLHHAADLGPDAICDKLEGVIAKIRVRQEQLNGKDATAG